MDTYLQHQTQAAAAGRFLKFVPASRAASRMDQGSCLISEKSKDGKILKALELPGLWNGAMADWITVFVEVPGATFDPVKTVADLLRPEHQPEG